MIIVISIISITFCSLFLINQSKTIFGESQIDPIQKYEPSSSPKRGLEMWLTSGYNLQPKPRYFVTLGNTVKIKADTVRGILEKAADPFAYPRYSWYKSNDGIVWFRVSSRPATRPTLKVQADTIGKSWYQLSTDYIGVFPFSDLYSNVAELNTTHATIPATSLNVQTDENYLFNINNDLATSSAYAFADLEPADSTESNNVNWDTSDHSLATIDENRLITANTKGRSGIVEIIGFIKRSNESDIIDFKKIRIGGGLDDQTVYAGQSATFELQSDYGESRDVSSNISVVWYQKNPSGKDKIVKKETNPENSISFTKDTSSTKENGSQYYATITVTNNNKTKSFTTNTATLNVLPSNITNVNITSELENSTFQDKLNSTTELNNVASKDNIIYSFNLNNDSGKLIHNSSLVLPLYVQTDINSIEIDNKKIDPKDYSLIDSSNHQKELTININDLPSLTSKKIKIFTTVKEITDGYSFSNNVHYIGYDDEQNKYKNDGSNFKINYINGKLSASFNDITFQSIHIFVHDKLKYRHNNSEMIIFNDQRRIKKPLKIYLEQDHPFIHESHILNVDMRFYQYGSFLNTLNNKILIIESKIDEKLNSLKWNHDEGLLLYVNNSNHIAGNYSSKLNWYIEDSL